MDLVFKREDKNYFDDTEFVKELKGSDFDQVSTWKLKDGKCSIVLFYAPWCPHCKLLKETWAELGRMASYFNVYAMNCEKQNGHVQKIKADRENIINGYPSIVIYQNGNPIELYQGGRDVGSLIRRTMSACK